MVMGSVLCAHVAGAGSHDFVSERCKLSSEILLINCVGINFVGIDPDTVGHGSQLARTGCIVHARVTLAGSRSRTPAGSGSALSLPLAVPLPETLHAHDPIARWTVLSLLPLDADNFALGDLRHLAGAKHHTACAQAITTRRLHMHAV